MSETNATITQDEWRNQINYKKTDGWKIVSINTDESTVSIRKSIREAQNHVPMTNTDRKRMYRSQVKDGNYEFLRAEMSESVLSSKELDDLHREGRDPRVKSDGKRNAGEYLNHSTTWTRGAKSED